MSGGKGQLQWGSWISQNDEGISQDKCVDRVGSAPFTSGHKATKKSERNVCMLSDCETLC